MNSTQAKSTVAAVVVTFNRKDLLCQCLDGILGQTRAVEALYVIDNASTDGTGDLIRARYADSVTYIRMSENLGGAGGFHHGMKRAYEDGFEFIWIMDDDVLPGRSCLEMLLSGTDAARIVSPLHLSVAGEIVEVAHVRIKGKRDWRLESYLCRRFNDVSRIPPRIEVSTVSFEGPLVHRSVIEKAGLPRADFFILFDDTEYCIRVSELNLGPILCITAARMTRLLSQPDGASPLWRSYHLWRNRLHSLRSYETGPLGKVVIDAHFFLTYFRAVLLRRVPIGEIRVRFDAWRDSYSRPFRSRYLPPHAGK